MRSLQKNVSDGKTGGVSYQTMFVWNEFLTRGIRNHLRNTLWTAALVYGFFKHAKLTVSGRDFRLTLIVRRSHHYAGTRICERKLRESILCVEFANAIEFINKDLSDDSRLRFLHWDLHKHSWSKAINVLALLGGVAEYALTLTGFFYCQVTPELITRESLNHPHLESIEDGDWFRHSDNKVENVSNSEKVHGVDIGVAGGNHSMKSSMLQKGVLRTNCIDCLDGTNVAQYAYGFVALGHQLLVLGFIDIPKVDLDTLLTNDLMRLYEKMVDTLTFQYGGSIAATTQDILGEKRSMESSNPVSIIFPNT
ncbi:hypothetical protein GIB67_025557 [Kingdonia uniflora]|uniref:SAC domain-containing protein n=1 Tax=Kingdonia uniflora TaxID=39325 RepID=A0A7J7M0M9_9MAGN|nr:hypothetical protein GIB67_025557 [Kingdonia uniflora]